MYYTARGADEREQRILDCPTALRFLELLTEKRDISKFFSAFGIKNLGIAAAGQFGTCLYKALMDSNVKVWCFIDKLYYRFRNEMYLGIPVIPYSDILKYDSLDGIVIASNIYFNEIADELVSEGILLENILSINDILFGVERLIK